MPENLPLAQTTGYSVQVVQRHSEGIVANPVAGPLPQNVSLVRLHAPVEYLSVYWSAVSEGKPPIVPTHKSFLQNVNRTFLGGERYGVITPTLVGHIWQIAGRYDYVVNAPEGLSSMFALAKCPWEGDAIIDFYMPAENFQTGIINPIWNQPIGISPDNDVQQINLQMAIQG